MQCATVSEGGFRGRARRTGSILKLECPGPYLRIGYKMKDG
jgi:hypothetical protein